MKGLLIKDFHLLKNQKQFFVMMLVVCVIMVAAMGDPSFIISYMTIIFSVFSMSTISYDAYDNGMSFLFTLPVGRKVYVAEKYVFGLLVSFLALTASWILTISGYALQGQSFDHSEILFLLGATFFIVILLQSLSLPIQLKFGPEKSRVALMLAYGLSFAAAYGLVRLLAAFGVDADALLTSLTQENPLLLLISIALLCLAAGLTSFGISLKLMQKKQF